MGAIDQLADTLIGHNGGPALDDEAIEAALAELSDEEIEALLRPVLAEEEHAKFNKFANFFPDDGPYSRHGYPKHLEFFRAGKQYRERCFMAGNRCITPWTYIETPDGPALSAQLMTSASPRVLSWDGESQCVRPMQDGMILELAPAFRVHLDNGRFFDCNRRHRVLTAEGWLSLDQLVSRADGLRWWQIHEDYLASCAEDGHLGDPQPLSDADSGQGVPPSRDDAPPRARLVFRPDDEAVHKFRYSHACQPHAPLSTPDDLARCEALFEPFSGAFSSTPVLSLIGNTQALAQLVAESSLDPRSTAEWLADQSQFPGLDACPHPNPGETCTRQQQSEADSTSLQLQSLDNLHQLGGLSLHDEQHTAMFFPRRHVPLVGGKRIICVVPLGYQPIIDAHVPGTNCYDAGGVIHHNTGKTVSGAYETTAHLTGLYPDWWEGRRFSKSIRAWVAGDTNETTRDIIQAELLGSVIYGDDGVRTFDGSGMIPRDCIGAAKWKMGVQDLADFVFIKHKSGGWSHLAFKAFEQGRKKFQGTAKELIWLDEECPLDIYGECLIRTATTRGILMLTFTPLSGLSDTVMQFLGDDFKPKG